MLNTLFSPTVSSDEKKKVLSEKYNIAMTAEMESEVQSMSNLSTAIENKGIKKGLERGLEQGIDLGELRATVKYYRKGKLTLEEAAEDLNMTVEEFIEKMNQIPAEAI